MTTYELTYVINPIDDDKIDQLLEAGDVIVASHAGLHTATIDVQANDAAKAAVGGAALLSQRGVFVLRLDPGLVNQAEIATRAGVSRAAVTQWAQGRTDPNGFPPPHTIAGGPLWAWAEVLEWLHSRGRNTDEPRGPLPCEVDRFNHHWLHRRTQPFARPQAAWRPLSDVRNEPASGPSIEWATP